jgi:hypothetical protein
MHATARATDRGLGQLAVDPEHVDIIVRDEAPHCWVGAPRGPQPALPTFAFQEQQLALRKGQLVLMTWLVGVQRPRPQVAHRCRESCRSTCSGGGGRDWLWRRGGCAERSAGGCDRHWRSRGWCGRRRGNQRWRRYRRRSKRRDSDACTIGRCGDGCWAGAGHAPRGDVATAAASAERRRRSGRTKRLPGRRRRGGGRCQHGGNGGHRRYGEVGVECAHWRKAMQPRMGLVLVL